MKKYKYIIIGGGMTGSAAVMGIRKNDQDGSIAMFTKEPYGPYDRPPLTKGLWNGKDLKDIMRPIDKFDIDLYLETEIERIDPEQKFVLTNKEKKFQYDKLLIATGGKAITLPNIPEGVITYRTREDYEELKALSETKSTFCVVGGGFIGSEIAAALTKNGKDVTMIFPEAGISGLRFPDDLAEFLNGYYQDKGVTVLNGDLVKSITINGDGYLVSYHEKNSDQIQEREFDAVIIGIGIKPNLQLAEDAGLAVDDGIVVNQHLQTSSPDIYAAGDVAYFTNMGLDKRMRVEHEDNANTMGMLAGKNMAGDEERYDHMPFFYSDLFDLGYEAVGELDKNYTIISDWIDPYKKGTIFYLQDDKIQGLIFWNLWGKVDQGRELIRKGEKVKISDLQGRFSN